MSSLVPLSVAAGAALVTVLGPRLDRTRVRARLGVDPRARGDSVPAWFRAAATAAGAPDPATAFRAWIAGTAVLGLLAVVVAPARIAVVVVVAAPFAWARLARGREQKARNRDLPALLDAMAAALRAGHSVPSALRSVAAPVTLRADVDAVAHRIANGDAAADALEAWSTRSPADVLTVAALRVAAQVGGAGARALDGAAASLRERIALDEERRALATQSRVSAMTLSAAPIVFAVFVTGLDDRASRFLVATPLGLLCLVAGLGLDGLGAWWMARLTRESA